jgi:hypothetical protein
MVCRPPELTPGIPRTGLASQTQNEQTVGIGTTGPGVARGFQKGSPAEERVP